MASIAAANVITPAAYTATFQISLGALTGLANGQVFKLNMPIAGTLTAMRYRQGVVTTTASKQATFTAQVNGVAVTGGVVTPASNTDTGTAGAAKAASAITAGNTFTAGQTVEAAVSAVTAFLEGTGYIEFDVTN